MGRAFVGQGVIRLLLDGPLREYVIPERGWDAAALQTTESALVHGRTRDGQDATLFGVAGRNLVGPFDEAREQYRADLLLLGTHAAGDEFTEAVAEFDWLEAWLDPSPIVSDDGRREVVSLQIVREEHAKFAVGDDVLKLTSTAMGRVGDSAVHLDRRSFLEVGLAEPLGLRDIIDGRIAPIHDLLTIALGRPVRLTKLQLRPSGTHGTGRLCEAYFNSVQPWTGERWADGPSLSSVLSYSAPTLFTAHPPREGLDQILSTWCQIWERERNAITLLGTPYHAPFLYTDHRFASAVQAVEALHGKARFGPAAGRDVPRGSHNERVEKVRKVLEDAVPEKIDLRTANWAVNVARSRNDKPFKEKIDEVVRSTGAAGEMILAAAPNFADRVTGARVGVSHGGASDSLTTEARYWHGEALLWVGRIRLLADAGVNDAADRACKNASFQYVVEKINR